MDTTIKGQFDHPFRFVQEAEAGPEPIYGLEEIRRAYGLSKPAFYGSNGQPGLVHDLPVTQLSARRKGVFRSALARVMAGRTTLPRNTA